MMGLKLVVSAALLHVPQALLATQLSGSVQVTGQPIPGATLTASLGERKVSTSSDETGRYILDGLSPGIWSVEVQVFGFLPARREITVGEENSTLNWTLEWKPRQASARPTAQPQGATQTLNPNQNLESEILAAVDAPVRAPVNETLSDANEAFLVSGSLSRGLGERPPEEFFRGPGGPEAIRMMMGRHGEEQQGQPPGFGAEGPARPAGPPGLAGPGGPGGRGPGPGGFGGGPGFGGPGGGGFGRGGVMAGGPQGGRGFPGQRPGAGLPDRARFGNRRNRGRDGIRGMANFSFRNSALDARPYSLTGQKVDKPSYAQNRFNIVAGGQLRIPKLIQGERTFFFADFSGTRNRNPYNAVATLPGLAERSGDFAEAPNIFQPVARQAFPNQRIPASLMNRAAAGLLPFIPLPNQPGRVQNYQYVTSIPQNSNNFGFRLNHNLSQSDHFNFSINMQNRNGENSQLYGFRDETEGRGLNTTLGWTHNLRRRLINRLNFTFSRNRSETVPFFAFKRDVAAELGITGTSSEPINYGPPNLSFTNFGGLVDASPVLRRDQNAAVSNSLILVRGRHNLTFGGEYRRTQLNSRTDQNARGTFSFSGLATSNFDARGLPVAGTGYDFADFLLGLPQSSSVRFGSANTYFRGSVVSFYGQNDWRVRPGITINLGLRYEFFAPLKEKFGHIANLDIAPGFTGVTVVTPGQSGPYSGAFPEALIDPDRNNLSPRIGWAWRPFARSRFQVRGGYGLFYNGTIYQQFPGRLASQPPFAKTASLSTSLNRTLTLQNGFAAAPSTQITNTYAVDRGYRIGYAQTWNLAIQQDLARSLVLEVGYLGTKGTKLDIQRLPNRAAPGSPLTAEQRRQIGNAVGFTFDSSDGHSIYHAGQVRLTRRFRQGFSANVQYNWSKSIDNASTFGGGGAVVAQNDKNLAAERGLSSFDQRHTFNFFYTVSSPVGPNGILLRSGGWAGRVLQDWNLSGGLMASSGHPLTARVLGNQADAAGTGSVGSGRAEASGAPIDAGGRFFNTAAFTLPAPGRFGNAGRNTIPGPGMLALNLSGSRSFRLQEQRRLEMRVESNNFTNQVSFTSLGTVVNASNYGLPTATRPMRTVSASLRLRF